MCWGNQASQQSAKKWKRYTNFSDTDRAEIGRYAAEYGNATIRTEVCVLVKIEGGSKIPYSGKFSRGRKFRDFRDQMPARENLFL